MCEARVYLERGGREELFFEDVGLIRSGEEGWVLTDIFGQSKTVAGNIKSLDLVNHKVVFQPRDE